MMPTPVRLEVLLEGNSAEIPSNVSLDCYTPAYLQNHTCVQSEESFVTFSERGPNGFISSRLSGIEYLEGIGEFFIVYGKKLKQVVMDSCSSLRDFSKEALNRHYITNPYAKKVADCIQKLSMEENDVRSRVRDSDSKGTTTALPTEISEFYNTTIRPFIESQTEFSATIRPPYANNPNMTSETPPQIEGPPQSNGTIAYCVGGVGLGIGVLITSIAAVAWKRKTLNEKRRKRYQEMVTSHGGQLVKSSVNNGLIPQNSIVRY